MSKNNNNNSEHHAADDDLPFGGSDFVIDGYQDDVSTITDFHFYDVDGEAADRKNAASSLLTADISTAAATAGTSAFSTTKNNNNNIIHEESEPDSSAEVFSNPSHHSRRRTSPRGSDRDESSASKPPSSMSPNERRVRNHSFSTAAALSSSSSAARNRLGQNIDSGEEKSVKPRRIPRESPMKKSRTTSTANTTAANTSASKPISEDSGGDGDGGSDDDLMDLPDVDGPNSINNSSSSSPQEEQDLYHGGMGKNGPTNNYIQTPPTIDEDIPCTPPINSSTFAPTATSGHEPRYENTVFPQSMTQYNYDDDDVNYNDDYVDVPLEHHPITNHHHDDDPSKTEDLSAMFGLNGGGPAAPGSSSKRRTDWLRGDEERQRISRKKRRWYIYVVISLFIIAIVVIAVAVILGRRNNNKNQQQQGTVSPTSPPPSPAVTGLPSMVPSQVPTYLPSQIPTELIVYDPPSEEDCLAVKNGLEVEGQESMIVKNFELQFDATVSDDTTDLDQFLEDFIDGARDVLILELTQCDDILQGQNRQIRRVLRDISNVIANAYIIDGRYSDKSCQASSPDPCVRVILNLELYLRGEERLVDLQNLIFGIIANDDEGTLQERLGLAGQAEIVSVVGVINLNPTDPPSSSPSMNPSGIPSVTPSSFPTTAEPSGTPTSLPSGMPSFAPSCSAVDSYLEDVYSSVDPVNLIGSVEYTLHCEDVSGGIGALKVPIPGLVKMVMTNSVSYLI
eukprot:scaffold8400_cov95-Cylindrotheca_fusiformis.AAC.4